MSSKKKDPAKKSLVGWISEFAGEKKGQYIASVFFALLSVACCIAPYFMIARIVQQLLAGDAGLGHLLGIQDDVQLFLGQQAFAKDQAADGLTGL